MTVGYRTSDIHVADSLRRPALYNKCTSDFIEVEFSIDVEVWHIDDIVQNVPAEGGVRIEQSLSSYSIGE